MTDQEWRYYMSRLYEWLKANGTEEEFAHLEPGKRASYIKMWIERTRKQDCIEAFIYESESMSREEKSFFSIYEKQMEEA